ncbi:septum formation family protein [Jatrophihabitans sp.]|uniref:septum formation family protein n=1 Tax=Jatrophihabitans sp. TaxID=1932789 RepID=UPI002CFF09E0|nr:septum formation family protein [Jatrophihabitans sp.]
MPVTPAPPPAGPVPSGRARQVSRAAALAGVALLLAGCGMFGGSKSGATSVSVFDVKPGQCFDPPGTVKSELSKLKSVPCDQPHTQESYASVRYTSKDGSEVSAYPGDAALKVFADGACAQQYTGYVGRDYLDSSYFFTYLLPSARGWEQQKDRNVLCFVTTTGQQLTASVKNSKR